MKIQTWVDVDELNRITRELPITASQVNSIFDAVGLGESESIESESGPSRIQGQMQGSPVRD